MNQVLGLLEAFEEYIQDSTYFDVVYSKKIGYFAITLQDKEIYTFEDGEAVLDFLYNTIIVDYLVEKESGNHIEYILTEEDEDAVTDLVRPYFVTMDLDLRQFSEEYLVEFIYNFGK